MNGKEHSLRFWRPEIPPQAGGPMSLSFCGTNILSVYVLGPLLIESPKWRVSKLAGLGPAESRLRPGLAAPQNQALADQERKLSDIGHSCLPRWHSCHRNL